MEVASRYSLKLTENESKNESLMLSIKNGLNKLLQFTLQEDKHLHFQWSFWMMIFASVIWPETWAIFFVMVIGLLKEIWDEKFGSGFCILDLVANAAGCLAAFSLIRIVSTPLFQR